MAPALRAAAWSGGWGKLDLSLPPSSTSTSPSLETETRAQETARHVRQNRGSQDGSDPHARVLAALHGLLPLQPRHRPPARQPPLTRHHSRNAPRPSLLVRPHLHLQAHSPQSPVTPRTPCSQPAGLPDILPARSFSQVTSPPPHCPVGHTRFCSHFPMPLPLWVATLSHPLSKLLLALQHPHGRSPLGILPEPLGRASASFASCGCSRHPPLQPQPQHLEALSAGHAAREALAQAGGKAWQRSSPWA